MAAGSRRVLLLCSQLPRLRAEQIASLFLLFFAFIIASFMWQHCKHHLAIGK